MATQLITFSLQTGAILLLLFLFYRLLLCNQPLLRFNRGYLLLAPLLALVLPLADLKIPFAPATILAPAMKAIQLPEVVVTANASEGFSLAAFVAKTGIPELLLGFYAIVAVVLLARLCLQLLQIRQLTTDADAIPGAAPHVKVLQAEAEHPTFAFLHYVFLNHPPHLNEEERQQVLDHELAHVQLHHTLDVLYYEVLVVLLWFNPAVWLLRAELLDVHEYQADAQALRKHQYRQYSSLIAKSALYANGICIGSNFSRRQIFRRLRMLQHAGETGSLLRRLLVLPLLGLLVFFLSAQQVTADICEALSFKNHAVAAFIPADSLQMQIKWLHQSESEPEMLIFWHNETETITEASAPESVKEIPATAKRQNLRLVKPAPPQPAPEAVEQAPEQKPVQEKPYTFAEQMPSFRGGEKALFAYIAEHLKYPEEAIQKRVQGQVLISFVIWQDGSIGNLQVLRGLGAGTDEEAIRVIQSMNGKWEPGRQNGRIVPVRYNIPLKFTLN